MRKGGSWEYVRREDPRNETEQGPGPRAQNTNKRKKVCECAPRLPAETRGGKEMKLFFSLR